MRRVVRPMVRPAGRLRSATARLAGGFRLARLPALAAVLVLVERALVGVVGSPTTLLRALPGHGDAWADPVVPVLTLMALVAETLIGYVLVVLVLRWSCGLPGALGRVAGRTELLLTPAMTRRALDLLVGGTLLAQATLAATPGPPGRHRPDAPGPAVALSVTHHVRFGPAVGSDATLAQTVLEPARHRRPADARAPGPARPTPRRSAAPLPPWLGGGPSKASAEHTVVAGDTLWDIAAAHLPPPERSVGRIHQYWRQVYRTNRRVVGADPDLIHPGARLDVLPFRSDR
jgi:resuscitation-promoting factor RpfA